jgi:hypothetical protein
LPDLPKDIIIKSYDFGVEQYSKWIDQEPFCKEKAELAIEPITMMVKSRFGPAASQDDVKSAQIA